MRLRDRQALGRGVNALSVTTARQVKMRLQIVAGRLGNAGARVRMRQRAALRQK
jgi:hypothetical protein